MQIKKFGPTIEDDAGGNCIPIKNHDEYMKYDKKRRLYYFEDKEEITSTIIDPELQKEVGKIISYSKPPDKHDNEIITGSKSPVLTENSTKEIKKRGQRRTNFSERYSQMKIKRFGPPEDDYMPAEKHDEFMKYIIQQHINATQTIYFK